MLLTLLFLACDAGRGDLDMPYCAPTETPLADDEPTPAGFTPGQVRAFAEGAIDDVLRWDAGWSTPLHLAVSVVGGARWVDRKAVYPEGESPAIGIVCDDGLVLPVELGFATDDGAFAERFDTELESADGARAGFSVDLVAEPLEGSFDPAAVPTDDYDTLSLDAVGWLAAGDGAAAPGRTWGEVAGTAVKDLGCDADGTCSASAETLRAAAWGDTGEDTGLDDTGGAGTDTGGTGGDETGAVDTAGGQDGVDADEDVIDEPTGCFGGPEVPYPRGCGAPLPGVLGLGVVALGRRGRRKVPPAG
jgi:hypothetical protein